MRHCSPKYLALREGRDGSLTPFFVLFLFVVFIIIFVVPPLFVKRRYIKKVPYNDLGSPTTRGLSKVVKGIDFFAWPFVIGLQPQFKYRLRRSLHHQNQTRVFNETPQRIAHEAQLRAASKSESK